MLWQPVEAMAADIDVPGLLAGDQAAELVGAANPPPCASTPFSVGVLDDADRALIESRRRSHDRLGSAVQLTTVRYVGVFRDDSTDIPAEVARRLPRRTTRHRGHLNAEGAR
ncbi:DUF4158 domain-containing protein [Streptomyces ferrugineus]|uniref:DUF4158 domain-containing protein n=1 Tax=Streptomyces ferrugineus TaxID=1413221 RepID=UPI001D15B920|nr:DUF4158 domain-containing protein [Streptomyces ferrugineus]